MTPALIESHLPVRALGVRALGPCGPRSDHRYPVQRIRRWELKGHTGGQSIRLTTNEWYEAAQLGDTYWLYVVWDPPGKPDAERLRIRNPVKHLDHVKREVLGARYYDIPAEAIQAASAKQAGVRQGRT